MEAIQEPRRHVFFNYERTWWRLFKNRVLTFFFLNMSVPGEG